MIDDIYVWCDGTWCYGDDLEEYLSFMSDDYRLIECGTEEYADFMS